MLGDGWRPASAMRGTTREVVAALERHGYALHWAPSRPPKRWAITQGGIAKKTEVARFSNLTEVRAFVQGLSK